jgi:hypothetical protein
MTDEATAETCVQVIDTTLVHTHVQLCSQLVVARFCHQLSPSLHKL